ncbi:MAG TPA: hypothetical protein VK975_06925 [Acidimicrobiales bacterium]|nr:hypothetical protein [Acidimicrobiales bacterium]
MSGVAERPEEDLRGVASAWLRAKGVEGLGELEHVQERLDMLRAELRRLAEL